MMDAAKRMFALTFTHRLAGDRFNRRLSEWHLAGVMFVIGIMLLYGNIFDSHPAYEVVSQIASQGTWAVFMIMLGTARLIALVVNGYCPRITAHARYLLASLSACMWSLLLVGFLAFDAPVMIAPFLAVAVIVDLISAFRAAQSARQADESGAGNGRTSG